MLPILATVGNAVVWFAATMGQLVLWGCGIGIGVWVAKKITNVWDLKGLKFAGKRILNKHLKAKEDTPNEVVIIAGATPNPA